jgi:predicted RNA-binding protein Jag
MLLTMMQCSTISVLGDTQEEISVGETNRESTGEPILAYVPLDNRPVNVDRVIYEAESAGFTVMMPDEDLYATRLDGQPLNSNGTQFGDSQKLLDWIVEMDKSTDYFVISLDQLLSGGLVNSRTLYNTKYYEECKMIDTIVELSRNNHVYIVDTVTRLASCTVGYQGATLDTYNYLRQYNLNARYLLKNKDLSVKNIVSDYTRDEQGRKISIASNYAKEIRNSLSTRERKLSLINYILSMDTSGKMKYFIGIDDSNPQNTIQTNEVSYIKKKMGDRGLIYSGADELGMMAVLNLMIDYYGYDVNAATIYFGDTESSGSGSVYDMETVQENVEKHLKSIGVHLVAKEKADLEIVVLASPEKTILNAKYINKMIDYINNNIAKGIPTIVINSAPSAYSGNLEYRMIRESEMSMLLSYSSWGTVGNSIGLALCNGISRYLYLHSRDNSSDAADIAFLKGLIFSYEKDISYIRGGGKTLFNNYLTSKGWSTSNFYQNDEQVKIVNADLENILSTSEYNVTVNDIIDNLTDCRYFKGLDGECGIIGNINLSNYSAPFIRTYEIRFDIDVDLSDTTINGFRDAMTIKMPYTPKEGELTYSFNLFYLDELGKLHKVPCTYDKDTGSVIFDTDNMPYFFTDTLSMKVQKANSLFSDVSPSSWYFDYVMYAYEKGLMNGTTSNTFEPKAPMTRAMLAYTLYKMAGAPETVGSYEIPIDVGNSWYKAAVEWALANEIVPVYENGTFGSSDPVTREQLANILYRYASNKGMDVSKGEYPGIYNYAEVFSVSPELRDGFDWACSTGIITGTANGTKLSPMSMATRAEVAAVLKRFEELQ